MRPVQVAHQVAAPRSKLQLVSLGTWCGPKLEFEKFGHSAATLPFDWMHTRLEGILHYLRTDFRDFFHHVSRERGQHNTIYRDYLHSFWWDDLTDPQTSEKYVRRIERLKAIDARSATVMFVRCAATTDELPYLAEVLGELKARFGHCAKLLVVIDHQRRATGPMAVSGLDDLLVYRNPPMPCLEYSDALRCAVAWAEGGAVNATVCGSLAELAERAEVTHWGLEKLGGIFPFEALPEFPIEASVMGPGQPNDPVIITVLPPRRENAGYGGAPVRCAQGGGQQPWRSQALPCLPGQAQLRVGGRQAVPLMVAAPRAAPSPQPWPHTMGAYLALPPQRAPTSVGYVAQPRAFNVVRM